MRQSASSAAQSKAKERVAPTAKAAPRQPTHLLVGDEALEPPPLLRHQQQQPVQPEEQQQGQQVVHYSWLTGCLAKRRRLAEADFHPAALAAAAAHSDSEEPDLVHVRQQGAAAAVPSAAAVAAAAAASAAAAGSDRPPLLRQLAVRSPMLTSLDVQQLVLHLLGSGPRPHWLSVHVSKHAVPCSRTHMPSGCAGLLQTDSTWTA